MRTEPMFVTPADFYNYWGLDLNESLQGDGNLSNKANIFLKIIEDRVMSYIDSNSFRNTTWEEIKEYPHTLECMQMAILTQAMYVYRNTDIALDSGYDPDSGVIAKKSELASLVICEAALNYLRQGGLFNQTINNRKRHIHIR